VIGPTQGLYLNTGQHKHRKTHTKISMPEVGFEPTIIASKQAKTVHANNNLLNKSQMWIKSLWMLAFIDSDSGEHFTLGTTYLCFLFIMIQMTHMLVSAGQTENWYEPRPMLLYFHR
jgi:hypothetical protein